MPSIDDLDPGDLIEFTKVSFGVGKFIRTIQRRKGGNHVDIELEVSLGKKITIREENIRWDKTLSRKSKFSGITQEVLKLSGTHLSKIESDVVFGFLEENISIIKKHQHKVTLGKIVDKLKLATW